MQTEIITSRRRRHRHHRSCHNCEERLRRFTFRCPRCTQFALTPLHRAALISLTALILMLLLKSLDWI